MAVRDKTSADPLVQALRGPSPTYKREAVDAVVAAGDECVPALMAVLREVLGGHGIQDDDRVTLYALPILAHLRATEAHNLLLALCRLPEREFEGQFGGFLTEGMDGVLFATADGRSEGLRLLVTDRQANEYLRTQAAEALALQVHSEDGDVSEVRRFLARQMMPHAAERGSYFWAGVAGTLLHLGADRQQRHWLVHCWDQSLIERESISRRRLETGYGEVERDQHLTRKVQRALTPDVHKWLSWWACFRP